MVIPDWTGSNRPPKIHVEHQQHSAATPLARPLDRLAASIVDVIIVLVPIYILLSAPLKRMFTTSFILGSEADFFASVVLMILLAALILIFYQAFAQYFFGVTIGKKIFGLRVVPMFPEAQLTFIDHLVRAAVWVFELTCMGLPWLSIFSNQRRRPWHDRICDTVVVQVGGSGAVPPTGLERSLVNSVFLVAAVFSLLMFAMQLRGAVERLKIEKALTLGEGDYGSCEIVDNQADENSDDDHARLKLAMTLYAAGLADRGCLEAEVEREIASQVPVAPITYLAQAFIYADDAEISNAYLDEVCQNSPNSVECSMSQLVTSWSDDNWPAVEEVLQAMQPGSGYLEIWGVRHYMKQAQYGRALELLDALNSFKSVAEFTMAQRVKALFNNFKSAEATAALSQAVLALPEEDSMELSSWVCAQELQKGCQATESNACRRVRNNDPQQEIDFEEPSQALAQVLTLECKGSHDFNYLSFAEAVRDPDWQTFFRANLKRQKEDRSAAADLYARLIASSTTPDLLKIEAVRRWAQIASQSQLNGLVEAWENFGSKEVWVKSGNVLLSRLAEGKDSTLTLRVAKNLMKVESLSPDSMTILSSLMEPAGGNRAPASSKVKEQVKQLLDSVEEEK